MRPWERRLKDLAKLLGSCHSTYLEPDLFRLNTNQFLQTSRTVTFIIQKNKEEIPNYAAWYPQTVVTPWANDPVMQWAKDARNTIEKEGDLELHSSLHITLLFSYLAEQDAKIECGRSELLSAGIKKLIRLARTRLPTGVVDAAVVKVERRWVTASLPTWELLHALTYAYARVYDCCHSLAGQFDERLDPTIADPGTFDSLREEVRQVRYVKLSNLHVHSLASETVTVDRSFEPPAEIRAAFADINRDTACPKTIEDTLGYLSRMAAMTFGHYGNHVPLLFLYNARWEPIDMLSAHFSDQADKFIFWRSVADRVSNLGATGLAWISESWLRSMPREATTAIRNMPIIGERLHVLVLDNAGRRVEQAWDIVRGTERAK